MTDLLTRAQDGFEAAFGYSADGIWSAHGRVNLIGEHTNYSEGFVLPFAIDRRTVASNSIPHLRLAIGSAFGEHGYRTPKMFVVRPSQGARREK